MKTVFSSLFLCFSLFSVLPTPKAAWEKASMRYLLCCLPLVGGVIGFALLLWGRLCALLELGSLLTAAGITLIPLLLSGGIHLDGFCDTVDALASHAPPERKRSILKDPAAGAFAVIYLAAYLLCYTALASEIQNLRLAAILPLCSRSVGALAGICLPSSGGSGLLSTFRSGADRRGTVILGVWCAVGLGLLVRQDLWCGIFCSLAAALCFFSVKRIARREFGGMSGDLAGFCICITELALLAAMTLAERLMTVWF